MKKKPLFFEAALVAIVWTGGVALGGSPVAVEKPVEVNSGKSFTPLTEAKAVLEIPVTDSNGWSFTIEPYLWALGAYGDVGVKGLPASHVGERPRSVLQNLDWGVMGKVEVRKGRWGILGDGLFAQLSASGNPPYPLYENIDIKLQQGFASLALAYRILDDRRGFLDVYAGARYNYLGFESTGNLDTSGLQEIGEEAVNDFAADARSRIEEVVRGKVARLGGELPRFGLPQFLVNRLKEAVVARALAKTADARSRAEAAIASAKKRLARAIVTELEDQLPKYAEGDVWWVDPIVGFRGQVNFTRWLYLATQADVGGFYAGSRIAFNVSASLGVNFTRNLFGEIGYRYMYTDYQNGGVIYEVGDAGIFSAIGVKF